MLSARQILLCIALLPMWALPPAHEATTYEVTKCHCINRDATPTMLQLIQLDVQEIQVSVRIIDRIGSDYHTLGTCLLNDEDGGIMQTIEHDSNKVIGKILNEVFHRWIKGQGQKNGKKTNTWETLVKCLKHSKLIALADEIETVLNFCTEKTLHVDDEECVREYMHDAPMETKSFLLQLISMFAAVVVGSGVAAALLTLRGRAKGGATDDEYTAYLKSLYKARTQADYTDDDHWPPPVTNKAFSLAIIKSEEVQRRSIDECFVRETITGKIDDILQRKVPIKLEQIFAKCERIKVLIEGAPGCGKSTLSVHICHKWITSELLKEYSKVILVRLRETEIQNAKNIADLLPQRKKTSMAHDVEKKIIACDGEGVLFIFDGWDELPEKASGYSIIKDILESRTLHKSSFIITCRPISSMNLHKLVDKRIEILGFTKDELQKYFTECLKNDHGKVKELQQRIKENPVIEGSCYLPLNASILVHLFKCGDTLSNTQFDIFSALICNCIFRHLKKKKQWDITSINSLDELPHSIQGPFERICEIAYNGVIEDRIVFDLNHSFNTLGLLQGVESFASGMPSQSKTYNFLHLSIQELLAAIHMATKLKPSEQVAKFNELFGRARFSAVFQFYAAKTKLKTHGINEIVIQVVQKCMQNSKATEFTPQSGANSDWSSCSSSLGHKSQPLLLSLLHCLFEAQDETLCQLVAKKLKGQLKYLESISLNPADCLSVGYFLTHCRQFKVYLASCSIGIDGCKALFRKGQKYDFQCLKYVSLVYCMLVWLARLSICTCTQNRGCSLPDLIIACA